MTGPFLLSISIFIFSFFIILFCLVPCGRFSWLYVSFWVHVNIIVSYRIVSYGTATIKAKFHYTSCFGAGSKPKSITLSGSNQLRTSSEIASVMEFGFKQTVFTRRAVASQSQCNKATAADAAALAAPIDEAHSLTQGGLVAEPELCRNKTFFSRPRPRLEDNNPATSVVQHRTYFSMYYYTKCVLLKASCATLKRKVCNIKFVR